MMNKKSALQPRIYIAESSPLYIELKSLEDNKQIRNRILTLMSLGVRYEQMIRSKNHVGLDSIDSSTPTMEPEVVKEKLINTKDSIPNVKQETIMIEANTKTVPVISKEFFEMYKDGGDIFDNL